MKLEYLRPTEVGTFTTIFIFRLSYKIRKVFGNNQVFVKLFFEVIIHHVILIPPTFHRTGLHGHQFQRSK